MTEAGIDAIVERLRAEFRSVTEALKLHGLYGNVPVKFLVNQKVFAKKYVEYATRQNGWSFTAKEIESPDIESAFEELCVDSVTIRANEITYYVSRFYLAPNNLKESELWPTLAEAVEANREAYHQSIEAVRRNLAAEQQRKEEEARRVLGIG